MSAPRWGRVELAWALALVLAVFALYAPVGTHDWVSYDDEEYLLTNPHLTEGLSWRAVRWFFTHPYAANYHPLTWVSHLFDVQMFGLEPGAHHRVNVALHALVAVLCAAFLRALLANAWAAGVGAALFALHPLRVEVVAWASERKELLCAAFFLAALLAYLRHARAPSLGRFALVLVFFALALLSKPMAVTFPLVACLLDLQLSRWHGAGHVEGSSLGELPRRSARTLLLEKLPLFALAGLGAAATLWAQSRAGATSSVAALALELRLLNALRSVAVYLAQSVWPRDLSVFYPHAALVSAEPVRALWPGALAGAALLATSLALAWRLRARVPAFALGLGFFLATLLPVIGLVQVGTQAHADRYTYLPSLGLALALTGAALAWAAGGASQPGTPGSSLASDPNSQAAARRSRQKRRVLAAAGVLAACALAFGARRQLAVWVDTRTLFAHALALDERNPLAHVKLGEVAFAQGDEPAARAAFLRALALNPRDVHALNKLALCHLESGELEPARARLLQALALDSGDVPSLLNLGVVALERGELDEARARFTAARARAPDDPAVHFDLGLLEQREGRLEAAEDAFRAALALDGRHADACSNLGQVLLARGRGPEALQAFARVTELAPEDPVAFFNLGVASRQQGDIDGARQALRRALALAPDFGPAEDALHALGAGE